MHEPHAPNRLGDTRFVPSGPYPSVPEIGEVSYPVKFSKPEKEKKNCGNAFWKLFANLVDISNLDAGEHDSVAYFHMMLSPGPPEIRSGPYIIQRCPVIPVPLETNPFRFKTCNILAWSLWSLYIICQLNFATSVQNGSLHIIWRMWLALVAEFCLSFQEVVYAISILLSLFSVAETEARPRYQLAGDSSPTVDVLVTCCGEPIDVIVNTVTAAAAQDYPCTRFRVFLLDDGHDERLRQAIEELNVVLHKQKRTRVLYLSRQIAAGARSYFKAGNLQYGIDESHRLGSSEYIAGLDADMIPDSTWLRKMVPHLILDHGLAIACPPQKYYNVPAHDPLGQQADFDMFFTIQEVLNDRLGGAMCTGTGYVVRRSALTEIGGWPLAETGEDYMCSALLSDAGWKIAFVRENLQLGLAPGSLLGLLKQRMRWTDAGVEVHQQFGYYLPGSKTTAKMTWSQRLVNMLYMLRDYAPVTNVLALALFPIALYPTQANDSILEQANSLWLRRTFLVAYIAYKLNHYNIYSQIGLSRVLNFQSNEIWAAPYMAHRCIQSLLPASFNTPTFAVCGTITSAANERSQLHRRPLRRRLFSADMVLYALYIVYASTPLLLRLSMYGKGGDPSAILSPFPGAAVKLLDCVWKMAVPLRYMIWPPTVPEWKDLVADDGQGVKRPKKEWGGRVAAGDAVFWIWMNACEWLVICLCGWW